VSESDESLHEGSTETTDRDFPHGRKLHADVFCGAASMKARGKMKDCVKIKSVTVLGATEASRNAWRSAW
jgi:hypothetical protein